MLFGYTDQGIDPRVVVERDDPRLSTYEGVLPGFDVPAGIDGVAPWLEWMRRWQGWLRDLGHDIPDDWEATLATEGDRPAEHSASSHMTDAVTAWLREQDAPWFLHVSYLRPHPPYAAAGHYATMYDPADVPLPIAPVESSRQHPLHRLALRVTVAAAPTDEAAMRHLLTQYYGMISEVDAQIGRLRATLEEIGAWDDTLIVVTSDHGEQAGDHGLLQKLGYWESSYHVLGIVRDPEQPQAHGTVVDAFTENVDVMPTLCDAMGIEVPAQCDGVPLTPWLRGESPSTWRRAVHWEYDWRDILIERADEAAEPLPVWDRFLETHNVTTLRTTTHAYVQFSDGSWRCFDLAADPTWRTEEHDPAVVLALAQQMLTWRAQHMERTLTGMLLRDGGIGRWPDDLTQPWADQLTT
jgi:arylsulfatase A-like enzyme